MNDFLWWNIQNNFIWPCASSWLDIGSTRFLFLSFAGDLVTSGGTNSAWWWPPLANEIFSENIVVRHHWSPSSSSASSWNLFFFSSSQLSSCCSRSVHSGMFFLLPARSSLVSHSGTNCWMLENGKKGGEISKFSKNTPKFRRLICEIGDLRADIFSRFFFFFFFFNFLFLIENGSWRGGFDQQKKINNFSVLCRRMGMFISTVRF